MNFESLPITQFDKDWLEYQDYAAKRIACIFGISLEELGVREVEGSIEEVKSSEQRNDRLPSKIYSWPRLL